MWISLIQIGVDRLQLRRYFFIPIALLLLLCMGCRIRSYMVPLIVSGEIDKMETQQAHRNVSIARVTREEATQEIQMTIEFAPPDQLRYNFAGKPEAGTTTLCVCTETFELIDPDHNRAQRIVNLPEFHPDTFREFRKFALRQALKENRAFIESTEEDGIDYWQLRTIPIEEDSQHNETVSYITKETKNNVRVEELDREGNVVNEFITLSKSTEVEYATDHFKIILPEGCEVDEIDFDSLKPIDELQGSTPDSIPTEHAELDLSRGLIDSKGSVFDYSQRQMVLLFIERTAGEKPLLIEPVSRETQLPQAMVYVNYAGTYTTCRWRYESKDCLVLTNLGPEIALDYARKILQPES